MGKRRNPFAGNETILECSYLMSKTSSEHFFFYSSFSFIEYPIECPIRRSCFVGWKFNIGTSGGFGGGGGGGGGGRQIYGKRLSERKKKPQA